MADSKASTKSKPPEGDRSTHRQLRSQVEDIRKVVGDGNEGNNALRSGDVNKLEELTSQTPSFPIPSTESRNLADDRGDLTDVNGETLALNSNQTQALGFPQIRQPATRRLLESLQFKNPGPLSYSFACFNPETSEREMRKLRRVMHSENPSRQKKKSTIYDDAGRLIEDGRDLCDCLDDLCPGCHYPCPECESEKCGAECRCNRRWLYEQIEVEGTGEVVRFSSTKSSNNKRA
ncbi:ARL14 effector protein-like [Ptychodera flava]|uniref:ARL14 effector protein-like n=1 Tax=Ptychodera flava TaxID=63121 RepID=UPI00396A90E3